MGFLGHHKTNIRSLPKIKTRILSFFLFSFLFFSFWFNQVKGLLSGCPSCLLQFEMGDVLVGGQSTGEFVSILQTIDLINLMFQFVGV